MEPTKHARATRRKL